MISAVAATITIPPMVAMTLDKLDKEVVSYGL